jgi:hypothetical protein
MVRSSHIDEVLASVRDPQEMQRFMHARQVLQEHLVCTREILNGKDFVFSGPEEVVHQALRDLVGIEHLAGRFLLFDYERVDEFYLLRIVGGTEAHKGAIAAYFDEQRV